MTTAPTLSSFTVATGAWSGVTYSHDSAQDLDNSTMIRKVYEFPASDGAPHRGFALVYYKSTGKQYINVNEGNPTNTDSPDSVENVTQSTGGSSGTAEVEYTTGDTIKMWVSSYGSPLVQVTTDSTWDFTSGGSSGGGSGSGPSQPSASSSKVFHNFW